MKLRQKGKFLKININIMLINKIDNKSSMSKYVIAIEKFVLFISNILSRK